MFVKPARLGSSVGISKVHDGSELEPAVELARRHDEKVLVEELLTGMEVECGVLGNRVPAPVASLPGRIDTRDKFDLVFCIGVLEYAGAFLQARDPFDAALAFVADVLSPDGAIVLARNTADVDALVSAVDRW